MSTAERLDPNESDPILLWAEIARLKAAIQGPEGYASWQEAATDERIRRVKAERELAAYRSTPADGGGQGVTPLTDEQIEKGREAIFSTSNPFCPCDSKTMRKAVRWAERAHRIGTPASTGGERKESPLNGRCQADRDGDCVHSQCPQLRDGEPKATGRHCPLDTEDDDA